MNTNLIKEFIMIGRIRRLLVMAMVLAACRTPVILRAAEANDQPNVVLIMADDLAYNDLSCYGSERINTPVLDKMAVEGIRLTSFYAGATVCSPSRMALLSGSYPTRIGWECGVIGYGMKGYSGLPRDVVTIAEVFKAAGYRTALSGKWHIGKLELAPMNQGFDETYYLLASNNQTKKLWRGDEVVDESFDNRRFTETFTQEAIRFITANKDKPFFLYLPYTAPHFPAEAHSDWKGHSANGAYGDVVEEMDSRIGEILATLKKYTIDGNTIVVFLSDNGTDRSQRKVSSMEPYTGGKWSVKEGGTRVPCIVRFPGVVPCGQVSDELTAAIDLFPTLAHACGVEIKIPETGQKLDGVNVWDTLLARKTEHPRTDLLYWEGWGEARAIRCVLEGHEGDWKLYFGPERGVPGSGEGPALFNLKEDPRESQNLSAQHPEKVKAMMDLAKQRLEDVHQKYVHMGAEDNARWRVQDWTPNRKWGKWLK